VHCYLPGGIALENLLQSLGVAIGGGLIMLLLLFDRFGGVFCLLFSFLFLVVCIFYV
jgi:hypothetical protein